MIVNILGQVEYEGPMREGMYEGYGKMWHFNGVLWYEGEFDDNAPCGEDCILFAKKRPISYEGKIKDGKTPDGKFWYTYF